VQWPTLNDVVSFAGTFAMRLAIPSKLEILGLKYWQWRHKKPHPCWTGAWLTLF